MRLRATAGAYAGQIRDYGHLAGQAALRTGMAVPVGGATTAAPPQERESEAPTDGRWRRDSRRKRHGGTTA